MDRPEFMVKNSTTGMQKRKSADNGGAFGALITDLSRAFDCLHRELLLGNLEACRFYLKPMRLIPQFL